MKCYKTTNTLQTLPKAPNGENVFVKKQGGYENCFKSVEKGFIFPTFCGCCPVSPTEKPSSYHRRVQGFGVGFLRLRVAFSRK